ncbi:hypothetical protein FB446DRAFT_290473 [Lentinula raphanica]|nr:hypothetical protein FB446DRAFT_290473 [Lentinula raphanica]
MRIFHTFLPLATLAMHIAAAAVGPPDYLQESSSDSRGHHKRSSSNKNNRPESDDLIDVLHHDSQNALPSSSMDGTTRISPGTHHPPSQVHSIESIHSDSARSDEEVPHSPGGPPMTPPDTRSRRPASISSTGSGLSGSTAVSKIDHDDPPPYSSLTPLLSPDARAEAAADPRPHPHHGNAPGPGIITHQPTLTRPPSLPDYNSTMQACPMPPAYSNRHDQCIRTCEAVAYYLSLCCVSASGHGDVWVPLIRRTEEGELRTKTIIARRDGHDHHKDQVCCLSNCKHVRKREIVKRLYQRRIDGWGDLDSLD